MSRGVAIVGYGHFGRALSEKLRASGTDVRAWDKMVEVPSGVAAATQAELLEPPGCVVLAVPVAAAGEVLTELRPHLTEEHTVIDVGSVKLGPTAVLHQLLGEEVPWAATHPLFGPVSLSRDEAPLRAVVCPNALHPNAALRATEMYRGLGCEVLELDAEAHDRVMAQTHALAYFIAKGLVDAGVELDVEWAPPSARAMARTVDAMREDAAHLLQTLHLENPFAAEARHRLLAALVAEDERLRDATAGVPAAPAPAAAPPPDENAT